ncbi:hypothetical protein GGR21_003380 [Dysgonomonas hofstadii]|uniref:Uncharacterized protein n=1 Tax=Dysgonomonas hofstadii TaxID=637886 RepID=A0A840CZP2_9BACT|nr:hypothetical protein [Dysgonomonas hofstadii]
MCIPAFIIFDAKDHMLSCNPLYNLTFVHKKADEKFTGFYLYLNSNYFTSSKEMICVNQLVIIPWYK